MKKFGLTFKIWLAMFVLVVLVLGLSALFQTVMIEKIYTSQQSDRILERGEKLAQDYKNLTGQAEIDSEVNAVAAALDSSVAVIDRGGRVVSWSANRGMGMGRGRGMGAMGGRTQGLGAPLEQADLRDVLNGETVVKKGASNSFGMDIMQVAIPIKGDAGVLGAVLVYTPLAPIEANLSAINGAVFFSLLLGAGVATLLAFVFSRSITRPIFKINSVARAMAGGNFNLEAPVRTGDELGVLAESINALSEQLKEKISTIEKTDEARRGFVASISHELRTPLTIMQGYTEALMDGVAQDDSQREKYLVNIYEETLRLRRLVDELLDQTRLESGTVSMKMVLTDLSEIVRKVAALIAESDINKDVNIKINLPAEKVTVRGDPDRLWQVVLNLVDNAVRFSPPGGTVEITGEYQGEWARVSVGDDGPGIAMDEQKLVWERFYKTDSSRSERNSGSGLGLAIARQIVGLHQGEIGIDSVPGKGSRFWFKLRAHREDL